MSSNDIKIVMRKRADESSLSGNAKNGRQFTLIPLHRFQFSFRFVSSRYFMVKLTVHEPVELEDDLFIKYLIIFKKWLMVEEVPDDKENIRNAFISQVKPKKTLW